MLVPIALVLALPVAGVLMIYLGARVAAYGAPRFVGTLMAVADGLAPSGDPLDVAWFGVVHLAIAVAGLVLNVLGVAALLLAVRVGATRLVRRETTPPPPAPVDASRPDPGQPPAPPAR